LNAVPARVIESALTLHRELARKCETLDPIGSSVMIGFMFDRIFDDGEVGKGGKTKALAQRRSIFR
jgi:hypothetical protein